MKKSIVVKPNHPSELTSPCNVAVLAVAFLLAIPGASRADILYVSTWNNTIEMFDLATGTHLGVFANTGVDHPMGLAFDSAGNLYVANSFGSSFGSTIMRFTPSGTRSLFASTGSHYPDGIAFDRAGNLYVAYGGDTGNMIERFTPDGVGSIFASSGLVNPKVLAFDGAGNLYAANYTYSPATIERFTPGGVGSVFAHTGLNYPVGLAFDSAGNLYAANQCTRHRREVLTDGRRSGLVCHHRIEQPYGISI